MHGRALVQQKVTKETKNTNRAGRLTNTLRCLRYLLFDFSSLPLFPSVRFLFDSMSSIRSRGEVDERLTPPRVRYRCVPPSGWRAKNLGDPTRTDPGSRTRPEILPGEGRGSAGRGTGLPSLWIAGPRSASGVSPRVSSHEPARSPRHHGSERGAVEQPWRSRAAHQRTNSVDAWCYSAYHQDTMPRTTLNIDEPVLRDLRRLQRKEGKSLGRLVSDLLARALHEASSQSQDAAPFHWHAQPMEPLVDLTDKEAVWALLDRTGAENASR
jgi:hypothetical protein